jgi:hypothetical protein
LWIRVAFWYRGGIILHWIIIKGGGHMLQTATGQLVRRGDNLHRISSRGLSAAATYDVVVQGLDEERERVTAGRSLNDPPISDEKGEPLRLDPREFIRVN